MSKREGIKIFQKHNPDFTKNIHQKALGILKVNSRDSDDLSLQKPHLKREAESRCVDWKALRIPREGLPWLVPGRVGIFVLIPVHLG